MEFAFCLSMNAISATAVSASSAATSTTSSFDVARLLAVIDRLLPRMTQLLADFVAAPSQSGAEQPATEFLERTLIDMGLEPERIPLDSGLIASHPLFSCPCDPDNDRYNLLARHRPREGNPHGQPGRSVLFNGHVDVVPTGPESLWTRPPYEPWVEDGWLYGRGSGDMKAGLICVLIALQALREMGLQPAGIVGFNAVLDEENTGNGTLSTLHALTHAMNKAKLTDFDAVIIPEPFAETMMAAQVGVCWLFVTLTGKPAHVAYMGAGINPIEAAVAVMADLKQLEADWNAPEVRHPAFADVNHPINFNLGQIEGGEWNSSVPCTCTLGVRFGFFPGVTAADATKQVTQRIREKVAHLNPQLTVEIAERGFAAPGCVYDLEAPAMKTLAQAHRQMHGVVPELLACTATTDGRHFALSTDTPVTNYGPLARNIHGIDESVSLDSMKRVVATMVRFMVDWCGVEPLAESSVALPIHSNKVSP
ncbi:MAG: acetylornithine deacetylase or succinyl-diaminopimelate desuccinylase [Rhizobacter sp.]|nr:acetylornithine deacetylase or succinyl-diaminopimelate desuccinylase [Rhizobacter sp.]